MSSGGMDDSDYSEGAYGGSSEEDASMMESDDDYAFDNSAAAFSSKSKVRGGAGLGALGGACRGARMRLLSPGRTRAQLPPPAAARRPLLRAACRSRCPRAAARPSPPQAQYLVLKREDIAARQAKAVVEVTSVLGLNEDEATRVLRKFKW